MKKVKVSYGRLMWEFMEIANLVERKNHDYGDAWQTYGIFTPLIRINDKILRVQTLTSGAQALVSDENIEDTLKDIVGYAMLALMWLQDNKEETKDGKQYGKQLDFLYLLNSDSSASGSDASDKIQEKPRYDISKWD